MRIPEITELERDDQREIIKAEFLASLSPDDLVEALSERKEEDEYLMDNVMQCFKIYLGYQHSDIVTRPSESMAYLVRDMVLRYFGWQIDESLEKWEESERENREMRAKGRE